MIINVSALFDEINVRVAETVLERLKNGSKYKLTKKLSSNGRGIGEHLEIIDNSNSNEAIIEFLQNYLREGQRLKKDTKKKVQLHIRNLRRAINETIEEQDVQKKNSVNLAIQDTMNLEGNESFEEEQVEGGAEMIYSSDNKYVYRSNSYEINDIIDFIIKARMENVSPFTLLNELDYPPGTVHTWYKDSNELRILYSLYCMNTNEKIEKFNGYSKEKIVEFNKDIRGLVTSSSNITEDLKNKYLKKIDTFNEALNDLSTQVDKHENGKGENNINVDVIKVITQTEEMWKAFANSNKEKIFEILYNDEEILGMVLKKIYK